MRYFLPALLLSAACVAPLLGDDASPSPTAPALTAVIQSARDDIRMQAVELTEVRRRTGEQRTLWATRLETLSAHVAALRRQSDNLAEHRRITRDEEQQLVDDVRRLQEECDFVRAAFREYRRSVPLRAGHAEAAYAETLLPAVDEMLRVGSSPSDLPLVADELMAFAETWNRSRFGGMRFGGTATDDEGVLHDGQFVVAGPHAWFVAAGSGIAGLAVTQPNSLNVALREMDAADAAAIVSLVSGKPASVPVDVSGGDALKVAAARPGLAEQWASGGFVMYPLAMVAVAALFLVLAKHISLARMTVDLVGPLSAEREALERAAAVSREPLRPLLDEACVHREAPRAHLEEVLSETVAAQVPVFERHLGTLAVLGGVAPLLGLLGTVTGMIHTFQLVNSLGTGNSRLLSGGISEALVTTKFGLAIAIPILLVHAFLARRSRLKLSQLEHTAARLVNSDPSTRRGAEFMTPAFVDISSVLAYWRSGGPLMVPLLFCCFLIWGYFLRSRRLIKEVIADARCVHDGRSADGPVGLLVTRSRRAGDAAAWEFEGEAANLLEACRRDVIVLGAITVTAPLLGLLGTVAGMSETFSGVAAMSSATTSRVAGGISTALVTTQFGLVVSIPGLFGVSMLCRLVARLRAALGGCRSMLLRECSHIAVGRAA